MYEVRKRKRRNEDKYRMIIKQAVQGGNYSLTDLGALQINASAPRYASRGLKTIWTNSYSPYIFEIWQERGLLRVKNNYLNVADKTQTIYELVTHEYKNIGGVLRKVEVIPYIKITYIDAEELNQCELVANFEFENIVAEVVLAMNELVDFGVINEIHDFEYYSDYIYKRLNAFVNKNRKRAEIGEPLYTEDENGEEIAISIVDRKIARKNTDTIMNEVYIALCAEIDRVNAHRRHKADKQLYCSVLTLAFVCGFNDVEIAKKLNTSAVQVARYKHDITRLCRESADFYDILTNVYIN